MSVLAVACAGGGGAGGPRLRPVTPAEIPTLKAQATQQPRNPRIRFRLSAALMAAGQCDSAIVVANASRTELVISRSPARIPSPPGRCGAWLQRRSHRP